MMMAVDGELSPSATLIEHEAEAVIEAVEPEPDPASEPVEPVGSKSAAVRYERDRIDKWIRDHLSQLAVRFLPALPPAFRRRRRVDGGRELRRGSAGRYHQSCHDAWRAGQEAAARQALGLEG